MHCFDANLLFFADLGNYGTVEEVDDAGGVGGVAVGVGDHDYGGAFAVEGREEFHDFLSVA